MKKILLILLLTTTIFARAQGFFPVFSQNNKDLIKQVKVELEKVEGEGYFDERDRENPRFSDSFYTVLVDLDKDNKNELIAVDIHPEWSGSLSNCRLYVFKYVAKSKLAKISEFQCIIDIDKNGKQENMEILSDGKYKTIRVNDYYYEWIDGKYR